MKLYGSYTSPYVRHCRIVLVETDLPHEFVIVDAAAPDNPSPTSKIPYLEDDDLHLSDSSSIVRHLREKAHMPFLPRVVDLDTFAFVNTLMDAAINVFYFQRFDRWMPEQSEYLSRQQARVERGLRELERLELPTELGSAPPPLGDEHLRLGCFLAWGLFRERFDLDEHPRLRRFLDLCNGWEPFRLTAPPAAG